MSLRGALQERRNRQLLKNVERAASGALTPVIIFQMGKVASSTLEATLDRVPGLAALRTHGLTKWSQISEAPPARRDLESWLIFHRLVRPGVKCKVVSAVRDPIARNLSAYFQNLDQLHGVAEAHARLAMPDLIGGFFKLYRHQRPLEWFDVEFAANLGIDVFARPFNRELGFQRLQSAQFDVLLLRAEIDDTTKTRQLASLVGVSRLKIIQKNVAEAKPYAAIYRDFLRAIRLPEDYVREMLEHRFTRHFFRVETIAALRTKWTARP